MDKIYEYQSSEQQARELWQNNQIYKFEPNDKKETFSIDTPPPTVSGTLHTGHIFSYTHTDIIARYKRLLGFNVFYPMGFDDNGLATERFVEKTHKLKAHNLSRSEFIKLCLKETAEAEKGFENLWKKVGLSIDWTKVYSTIEDRVRKISQISFIELYNKNLIYRKSEPALYCTTCRTSVAQAELDDAQVTTNFNNIEFLTEDGQKLVIATTRPELLPACVAIFFHPEDSRYKHLENQFAIVPVFNKKVKILSDDKVKIDKGTGLVMCCTFGDQTDIYWYKKHNLPFIQVVGHDGLWTEKAGILAGLNAHDARKKIIEILQTEGKLLSQEKITHSVNVHERCKQEIEYLVLSQWFVKILENREKFLELAEQINWKPDFMKARYKDWVENLGWDWCISRQRFYGIPFPVWHCQDCHHIILADQKTLPIDPQEENYPGKTCPKCSSTNLKPDTDVMDTWNTSSLTPQINLNWPINDQNLNLPMSMRPQAHDIIRTWAFYTIVKAYYHNNNLPWKDIVISGHVLAGKEKISKSKGNSNVPTPAELLEKYPADVIRYWSANGKLGTDTAFSENQLKIGLRLTTKLWNAYRFCKDQLDQYNPKESKAINLQNFDNLNKWLLHKFGLTLKNYNFYFEKYDYTLALETIEKFFWQDFCDNYLELIKDQIFNPSLYKTEQLDQTRYVLHQIGFGMLQLFAPVLPHITETLYQNLFKRFENEISLFQTKLDSNRFKYNFEESFAVTEKLIELITECRKLKTGKQLSLKTELEELLINSEDKVILEKIKAEENFILGITKAKKIKYLEQTISENSLVEENGTWKMQLGLK